MADRKLTELTEVESLGDGSLFYAVDPNLTAGNESVAITKTTLTGIVGSNPLNQNPVENVYADNATMFADQVNQTTRFFNYVTSGDNYYEKLATNTASISDYRLLSEDEVITIQDSSSYRTFSISDIQDDAVPLTSVGGGKIGIEYDSVSDNVTGLFFNARYTNIIANIIALDATLDYYIRLYNGTSRFYDLFKVTGFAVVNTDYVLCSVDPTVDRTVYSVNDRLEVNFDVDVASTSDTRSRTVITGTSATTYDLDISAGIRWDLTATGNLTLTYSNPVIDGDSNQIYLTTGGFSLTVPADWTAYPNSESITGATLVMIVFDVLVIDGGGNDIRYNITVVE